MTDLSKKSSDEKSDVLFQKNAIRRRFLNSVVTVLLVLGVVGLPISLSRIPSTGLHPNHVTHLALFLLIFLLFFLRKRISAKGLLVNILLIFSVLSVSAFLQYGLVSAGFYFASAAIFVTAVGLGLRAGLICSGLFGVFILFLAYLWITGLLVFPGNLNDYIVQPSVWATLGAAFLITTAVLFVSATVFFSDLTKLVDTIDQQKRKIEERTAELARANQELQEASGTIKTLSGLLPICSNCKKIRDDQGYWQQIEQYVQHHSQAIFSHSLCPDCIRELYPEVAEKVLGKLKKN